jgi:hypothetical protein
VQNKPENQFLRKPPPSKQSIVGAVTGIFASVVDAISDGS